MIPSSSRGSRKKETVSLTPASVVTLSFPSSIYTYPLSAALGIGKLVRGARVKGTSAFWYPACVNVILYLPKPSLNSVNGKARIL